MESDDIIDLDRVVIGFWPREIGAEVRRDLADHGPILNLAPVSGGDAVAVLDHYPVIDAVDPEGNEVAVVLDFFQASGREIMVLVHHMKATAESILDDEDREADSNYALSLHEFANAILTSMLAQNIGYLPDDVTIIIHDDEEI